MNRSAEGHKEPEGDGERKTLGIKLSTIATTDSVQCFGRKKTAVAVTYCKRGRGLIKINGCPIELIEPEILSYMAFEPILLLGRHCLAGVDKRIRVKGGDRTRVVVRLAWIFGTIKIPTATKKAIGNEMVV